MVLLGTLLLIWFALLTGLSWFHWARERLAPSGSEPPPGVEWPRVSILVPAYNEGRVLEGALRSLLRADYPDFEVIVIDDGSKDDTLAIAHRVADDDPRVRVVAQRPNAGKAAALNRGVAAATSEIVVCVDADTVLAPDALRALVLPLLHHPDVTAVSGNIKVGNRRSWLTTMQSIEYIVAHSASRRAKQLLGCITTVPGAAGAFRRQSILDAGGYCRDTMIEDTDLTITLLERRGRVVYAPSAVAYTEAPERVPELTKQRLRWATGYLQVIGKYLRSAVRPRRWTWIGLPDLLIVNVILPLFVPLSAGYILWQGYHDPGSIIATLVLAALLDLALCAAQYAIDRESPRELLLVPVWRVAWPVYIGVIYLRAAARLLRRVPMTWGALQRTGHLAESALKGLPAPSSSPAPSSRAGVVRSEQ